MTTSRRVVVASADRLMREALPFLLRDAGWEVAAVAADGVMAMAAVARAEVDAVLIVNGLQRPSPGDLARELQRRWPALVVVVVGDLDLDGALPTDEPLAGVLLALETSATEPACRGEADPPRWIEQLASLTPRERSILKLLGRGLTMEEVAVELKVSDHTVRTHMQKLYAKLDCHNRLEVVRFATRHGLVTGE
ncbi:MAG TPA: response regulator transcription factor [Actinomycetota bacterium]|nr:response regulator transcription factor [Actinomycetota bacterium]